MRVLECLATKRGQEKEKGMKRQRERQRERECVFVCTCPSHGSRWLRLVELVAIMPVEPYLTKYLTKIDDIDADDMR